jgi:hypothetical protein
VPTRTANAVWTTDLISSLVSFTHVRSRPPCTTYVRRPRLGTLSGYHERRPTDVESEEASANAVLTTAVVDTRGQPWTLSVLARRLSCSGGLWWTRVDAEILLKSLLAGAVALPREFGAGLRVVGWRGAAAALWCGSRPGWLTAPCGAGGTGTMGAGCP